MKTPIPREDHEAMELAFPPPQLDVLKNELSAMYANAVTWVAVLCCLIGLTIFGASTEIAALINDRSMIGLVSRSTIAVAITLSCGLGVIIGTRRWIRKRVGQICDDEAWEQSNQQRQADLDASTPETAVWFDGLIGSIWPLVNPDLFSNIADTLEDVLQASLPRFVRMISVEDIGQGSEPIRILGVKWLPRGDAAKTVKDDSDQDKSENHDEDTANITTGMHAEEGEFVNLELAFAYTARHHMRKFKDRAKLAHLYLAFYFPGNIKIPVWVELRGLVGAARMRMQLTPDPPFLDTCTITLLGQPKTRVSCVPLVKYGLNIMDMPFISNFVQSAVDAAMASYVAPKSYTLNLRSIIKGDDFKRDTTAIGVLVVRILRAYDIANGDANPLGNDYTDGYVSVGWAKFGKPVFSTRVLVDEMEPSWDESCHVLVEQEDIDAQERLRVQLWDSDRFTADDDLGRIEIDLQNLMKSAKNVMLERKDHFQALRAGEEIPGTLEWSVGYFPKTGLMDYQVAARTGDSDVKTAAQLKRKSFEQSKRKLRESDKSESDEMKQLQQQDYQSTCDELISGTVPSDEYPSGILSIQIHQVVGLQLERANRGRDTDGNDTDGLDLPDSYCVVVLNHEKIFRTRTKPRTSKPFFNACTERFIPDWRSAVTAVYVRDSRVHEDPPLLGVVRLPLAKLFRSRSASRLNEFFPLAGGIGFGRIRISIVFRSVQLQAPQKDLGWNYGTLEISHVKCSPEIANHSKKIRFRTAIGSGSMSPSGDGWATKNHHPLRLPVRNRYATPLIVTLRAHTWRKRTAAFSVLWLKDLVDEEEREIQLAVSEGEPGRAEFNVLPEDSSKRIGTITLTVRLWRGIGRWHAAYAKKKQDISNIIEVLECMEDNDMGEIVVGGDVWLKKHGGEAHSDFDSSESEKERHSSGQTSPGILEPFKGYNKHKDQLHRRHRGIMQWQVPRTMQWTKHKLENAVHGVTGVFEHHGREPGIETET